jgi:hypothetical protein
LGGGPYVPFFFFTIFRFKVKRVVKIFSTWACTVILFGCN